MLDLTPGFGGDAADECLGGYVLVNQGAGGDDGTVADVYTGEDRGVGADHDVLADDDFTGGPFMDEKFMGQDSAMVADDSIVAHSD